MFQEPLSHTFYALHFKNCLITQRDAFFVILHLAFLQHQEQSLSKWMGQLTCCLLVWGSIRYLKGTFQNVWLFYGLIMTL